MRQKLIGLFVILALSIALTPTVAAPVLPDETTPDTDEDRAEDKLLAEALGQAREELERQQILLAEERKRLELLKRDVQKEIKRLSALLQPVVDERKQYRDTKIRHMVKALSAMSPEAAAAALAKSPDHLAVELLSEMNSKLAGKVLEVMQPERSADLIRSIINRPLDPTGAQK